MREQILSEIRRLTTASGGVPPGVRSFESETGIRQGAWRGRYWATWGEALTEAGFQPNTVPPKIEREHMLTMLVEACRHFGRIPSMMQLRMYRRTHPNFPGNKSFSRHYGTSVEAFRQLAEWVTTKPEFADVAAMAAKLNPRRTEDAPTQMGFVYLMRSGPHYKIGRSDEIERRMKQIRITLPEATKLVHTIKTDDPPGIEAYWHRRFADRRANGEWFKLAASDVAAFKRRKFQ